MTSRLTDRKFSDLLYDAMSDPARLPYRLTHAKRPNSPKPHSDEEVLAYARENVADLFRRADEAQEAISPAPQG